MAPIVMHAVIGERVFPQVEPLAQTRALGAFLLGCMLVDVNGFSDLDRRQTHFSGRPTEEGEVAFSQGTRTFLSQLDQWVQRPWFGLAAEEQAFVAGYLCHLAADEAWKSAIWRALWSMGITDGDQLPIPGGVILTAYSFLSVEHYLDAAAVADALRHATVPDVLTHVPHEALLRMWRIIQPCSMDEFTLACYLAMLEAKGRSAAEVAEQRRVHERYLEDAKAFIQETFDVPTMIQATVDRSLEFVPRLWS
jgi:hypothetical protein